MTYAEALGISQHEGLTYVVGFGHNSATGRDEALMWIGTACDQVWFSLHPSSVALVPGTTATFSAGVNGTATGLRWRRNGVELADGGRVSGTTTAQLQITGVQAADEGVYDCVVSSVCNMATSAEATLTCDPILLSQPPGQAFLDAGLQLTITVPPGAPYSYRWRQDGQNLFNIPGLFSGVTTRTLTFLSADPSLEGAYDVVVTDSCGTTNSAGTAIRRCFPDMNRDGNADQDDVVYLINVVGGGANPEGIDPDFNRDGNMDQDDISALVGVIAAGACP